MFHSTWKLSNWCHAYLTEKKDEKTKNFLIWLITKWLYAVIFTVKKTGDCAYDFRHQHIQLRKKLNWCKVKFGLSEKHTKFEKNIPHGFDKSADLLSKRQNHEEDFFKLCVLLENWS